MRLLLLLPLSIAGLSPLDGQAVTLDPELALVAERIFRAVTTEVVFCLHATPTPYGGWHVTEVRLAPQGTEPDRDGATFDCAGADGFMHNHPREGTRWCRLSEPDRRTLERYRFAILWCPARRFTYEVREPPPPPPPPRPPPSAAASSTPLAYRPARLRAARLVRSEDPSVAPLDRTVPSPAAPCARPRPGIVMGDLAPGTGAAGLPRTTDPMPAAILLALVIAPAAMPAQPRVAADTVLVLREVHRDMTGDGAPEVLRLTGRGDPADSLEVRFTIHAGDAILFEETFALTRLIGWGSRATLRSPAEMLEFVEEYPDWFFDPEKFQTPAGFIAELKVSRRLHQPYMDIVGQLPDADTAEARAVWREMEEAGVTVFGFSSGGDRAVEIAWSPAHRRFFYVSICC